MKILRYLIGFLLLAALVLTYVSWLKICSEQCAEGALYRLYGFPFEFWGFIFFTLALLIHIAGAWRPIVNWLTLWLLTGALGSELWFVWIQKYKIGHWCPICLSIASVLVLALLCTVVLCLLCEREYRSGGTMRMIGSWMTLCSLVGGFLFAFVGIEKMNPLRAAEEDFAQKIAFGKLDSPIEVYFFTDWECPACRKLAPAMDKIAPLIMEKARLIFVDLAIHQESLNFTPYNLAFMVHNKQQYMPLRHVLESLALKTKSPSEEQVTLAIKPLGVTYTPLNYADVAVGLKYYRETAKRMGVDSTPTLVGVNTQTKQGKRLRGGQEISQENVVNMINALAP